MDATPTRMSGEQNLVTLERGTRSYGSERLDQLLELRRASGIDQAAYKVTRG